MLYAIEITGYFTGHKTVLHARYTDRMSAVSVLDRIKRMNPGTLNSRRVIAVSA